MTIIVPPSNFNDSHTYNTHPTQLQAHAQPESSCAQEERLEQVSQCLETVYTSINTSNMPSGPQKSIITQPCRLHQEISVPT